MSAFGERVYAYSVSVALIGAVLWPTVRTPPVDSFPLSTLPMFSRKRPAEVLIDHVVAVNGEGVVTVVPPSLVAGSEVLQTKAAITYAVRRGPAASLKLCHTVAERLAKRDNWTHATRVEVRRDRYHVLKYFDGHNKPLKSLAFARCPIERTAP